jgi:hypothetical protein
MLPTTATDFIRFMEGVWDIHSEPGPDGGIILYQSPLYDAYHNANRTAKLCGMHRTGGTRVDGQECHVYRFLDHADGVRIGNDGNSVSLAMRVRHSKVKGA